MIITLTNMANSKKKENSILKDGLYVLVSNYFAQACNIVRGFYSANILGPAGYGFWSIIQFYVEFGKFSPLGMDESASREITQNILKKRTNENLYTIKIYTLYSLLLSFITFIFGGLFLYFFGKPENQIQYYGVIFVTGSIVAWQMDRVAYTILSAYGKFAYTSLMRALYAIISLTIVVTLIQKFEIIAMYWSYFVATIIPPIIIAIIYSRTILNKFNNIYAAEIKTNSYTKMLFRNSFSLLIVSVLNAILANLDRFFVAQNYSNYDNGIYFFAANIAMSLNFFIFSFTVVIYQRMNLSYGEHSDHKITFEYIIKACRKAAIYFPYIIIVAYYIIPSFFVLMFPEYVASIFFLRCFVFAGYFYSIFMLLNYELMAIKKQKLLNIMYIIIIALGSAVYLLASKKLEIASIPYLVIALSIVLMLSNLYLSRKISGGIYKKRRLLLTLLSTPAIVFIIMRAEDYLIPDSNVYTYLIKAAIVLAIYFVIHKKIEKFEL